MFSGAGREMAGDICPSQRGQQGTRGCCGVSSSQEKWAIPGYGQQCRLEPSIPRVEADPIGVQRLEGGRHGEGDGLSCYLPTAVTGLAEGHILVFFAVHAETDLGRFLTTIQLELHLGHVVKEFGKVALNL